MGKIRDIAININQITLTAFFNTSKLAIIDISSYNFGNKKPTVLITSNDSGAQPLFKTDITSTIVKIRCNTAWTGSCDVTITKNY